MTLQRFPIITLTTDWERSDHYIGTIKGALLSLSASYHIIDINHCIEAFNIYEASYVIRNSFMHFPKGTIHIIGVKSEKMKDQCYVAVLYKGHYFVTCDNGLLSFFETDSIEAIHEINLYEKQHDTFPELSIFVPAAHHIAQGKKMSDLGPSIDQLNQVIPIKPTIDEHTINGSVIYIDSYQNAITNITKDLFERIGKERKYEILVQSNKNRINRINQFYNETADGELLALFNTAALLEIAINNGNAAQLLTLNINSTVRIQFKNE